VRARDRQDFSPVAIVTIMIGAAATLAWAGILVWGVFELVGL